MPMIPSEDINKIRSNANIVDIISSYLNLEPKGKNYFGLCPFHDDNSPSMSVSPEKQIFTCFVCGVSGNVFSFVQNYENVEFPESVKIVANKIGYSLNYESKSVKKFAKELEIMELANKFYINNLKSDLGKEAINYLKKRDINDEVIKEFNLGVALNDNNLSKLLLSKGYDEKLLIDLGLANKNDDLYDVFRGRITFPINNPKGEVVAFSARLYHSDEGAKYVNSKESVIFKKGHLLFNYDKAKLEANKTKSVILVEGQMDAIRIYASGVKNVVATMGTALTKEHVDLLKRLNAKVILMMDNDDAGEKTTLVAGEMLEKANIETLVVKLEGANDPDDYIIKNGIEAFKTILNNPISYFDYKMLYLKKNKNLNKADELATYVNNIITELNKSDDEILKEVTINNLSKEFNIDKDLLRKRLIDKEPVKEIKVINKPITLNKAKRMSEALLYMMMSDVKYLRLYERQISYIPNEEYNQLANDILAYYKLNKSFELADFISFEARSPYYETLMRIINEHEAKKLAIAGFEECLAYIKDWIKKEQIKALKEKQKNTTDINEKQSISDMIIKLKKESEE